MKRASTVELKRLEGVATTGAKGGADIVDQDYGTRADTMLQHQGFVRALNSQARLKGFEPTDTVRKLYGVA